MSGKVHTSEGYNPHTLRTEQPFINEGSPAMETKIKEINIRPATNGVIVTFEKVRINLTTGDQHGWDTEQVVFTDVDKFKEALNELAGCIMTKEIKVNYEC